MIALRKEEIGGGVVRRPFNRGTERLKMGHNLTRDEILAMPRANRDALVSKGMLHLVAAIPGSDNSPKERFVVNRGSGQYDVIEGSAVNAEPLSKKDAETLAALQ